MTHQQYDEYVEMLYEHTKQLYWNHKDLIELAVDPHRLFQLSEALRMVAMKLDKRRKMATQEFGKQFSV